MSKKIFFTFLFTLLVFMSFCLASYAADDVSLVINNQKINCEVPPVIINDRTLVPVRVLFEHLNAKVSWNGSLRQVVVTSGTTVMIFNIDSQVMYLNGAVHTLDTAPVIINDRTLVPVRFISEKLGYIVGWNSSTRTVSITRPTEHSSSVSITKPGSFDKNDARCELSSIKTKETDNTCEITVTLAKKVVPKTMSLTEPHRLIFDFYDVNQTIADGNIASETDFVTQTRWAEHPDYTRVVVETAEKCTYSISYISNKSCKITITKPGAAASSGEEATPPKPAIVPSGTPVVVLDAGHGGYDPGAIGKDENGNDILFEKEVCLNIAKKTQQLLEAQGVEVIMTRTADTAFADNEMDDLVARCEIANNSEACLFVSIHNNAFTNSNATGTCVLYSGLASASDYGISNKELAQNIQDCMVDATGLYDRGIVESPGIVVLKKTAMPAVLIECAFITCPNDQKLLGSETGRADMAQAIAQGIITSLTQMDRLK